MQRLRQPPYKNSDFEYKSNDRVSTESSIVKKLKNIRIGIDLNKIRSLKKPGSKRFSRKLFRGDFRNKTRLRSALSKVTSQIVGQHSKNNHSVRSSYENKIVSILKGLTREESGGSSSGGSSKREGMLEALYSEKLEAEGRGESFEKNLLSALTELQNSREYDLFNEVILNLFHNDSESLSSNTDSVLKQQVLLGQLHEYAITNKRDFKKAVKKWKPIDGNFSVRS